MRVHHKDKTTPIFRSLDTEGRGALTKKAVQSLLCDVGIGAHDVRLAALFAELEKLDDNAQIGMEDLDALITKGGALVERAAKHELVIGEFPAFRDEIEKLYWEVKRVDGGEVANYIPQLAQMPRDKFGVAICTIDGQRLCFGDALVPFTLQSSVKPFLYAAALEEHGAQYVHRHVGREPSGVSFNELTLNRDHRPHNPMINAGAIMSSSLVGADRPMADRLDKLHALLKELSGDRAASFNNAVYHSERETADRNFALAHYMREVGAFPEDTDIFQTLDYYFSACSFEVTAKNMSVIGATLANGGVCPRTGRRVFSAETVKNCLSMMYSCGMYDYSGEFAFNVGLPAKSAVSGIVLGVVPNVMAIAVWSPPLDECGNSVRGIEFFTRLVERFNLHTYDSLVDSDKVDIRNSEANGADPTYAAIYAASIGDLQELRGLVARGHDLNKADYDGRTPLHLAAAEGQRKAVDFLLKQEVDVAPLDRWGHTPVDDAIRHNKIATADLIVSYMDSGHGPAPVAVLDKTA